MSEKRLYVVNVQVGFPVMASSEDEAISFTSDVLWDLFHDDDHKVWTERAQPINLKAENDGLPKGWAPQHLVYNGHGMTVEEAMSEERKALQKAADFDSRQLKMF